MEKNPSMKCTRTPILLVQPFTVKKKILKFVTVVNMSFLDNNHPNWRQFIDTFSSDVFYSLTVILYLKVWALLCTVRRALKIS